MRNKKMALAKRFYNEKLYRKGMPKVTELTDEYWEILSDTLIFAYWNLERVSNILWWQCKRNMRKLWMS